MPLMIRRLACQVTVQRASPGSPPEAAPVARALAGPADGLGGTGASPEAAGGAESAGHAETAGPGAASGRATVDPPALADRVYRLMADDVRLGRERR
jgi:hypothetical protein